MERWRVVLVAVFLVTAVLAGTGTEAGAGLSSSATTHQPPTATQSARMGSVTTATESGSLGRLTLAPDAVERNDLDDFSLDVSSTLSFERGRAGARLASLTLNERLEAAETNDERYQILINETERIDQRIAELHAEERRALEAYNAGSISTAEFLRRLAGIHERTEVIVTTLDRIRTRGRNIQSTAIIQQADELDTEARTLQGPVRDRIASAQRGTEAPIRAYAETSPNGIVLSAIFDGTYVREAWRYDRRATSGPTNSLRKSIDTAYAVYTEASSNISTIEAGGQRAAGLYFITLTAKSGVVITTYIDNRNLTVFKEFYRRPLGLVEFNSTVVTSDRGLRLTVRRTHTGGPMRVTLQDTESMTPVRGTVSINETVVGETGADGSLWLLTDRPTFVITARSEDGTRIAITVPVTRG